MLVTLVLRFSVGVVGCVRMLDRVVGGVLLCTGCDVVRVCVRG